MHDEATKTRARQDLQLYINNDFVECTINKNDLEYN